MNYIIFIKKNYSNNLVYQLYKYFCVSELYLWFTIVNEHNEIIVECSINNVLNSNSFIKTFELNDVYVEEKFRDNNYGQLMILNVLNYLDQKFYYYNYIIKTSENNYPAIITYKKI
jgi:ribosomal protein S18 acetylase RimI-like enzyme